MKQTEDNNQIHFQNSDFKVKSNVVSLVILLVNQTKMTELTNGFSEFNRRLNVLLSTFNHVHAHVKYIVFKTYCMPFDGSKKMGFFPVAAVLAL